MRLVAFRLSALHDYTEWARTDKKVYRKIEKLIDEIVRDPYVGTREPEALKHELAGFWSRRFTLNDRLIYEVRDDEIVILSCKGHYDL